ncbi:hypothetical protein BKA63DRAFT_514399 [Paraphoma chrysanthemicola]|nr:hypothetical protein BKA63DRAFT_514399 [Paraphoma chrysanthemicola]
MWAIRCQVADVFVLFHRTTRKSLHAIYLWLLKSVCALSARLNDLPDCQHLSAFNAAMSERPIERGGEPHHTAAFDYPPIPLEACMVGCTAHSSRPAFRAIMRHVCRPHGSQALAGWLSVCQGRLTHVGYD